MGTRRFLERIRPGHSFAGVCSLDGTTYIRYYELDGKSMIEVWDTRDKRLISKLERESGPIMHIILSRSGDCAIFLTEDGVYTYDTKNKIRTIDKIEMTLPGPGEYNQLDVVSASEDFRRAVVKIIRTRGSTTLYSFCWYVGHDIGLLSHHGECDYYISGGGKQVVAVFMQDETNCGIELYDENGKLQSRCVIPCDGDEHPEITMSYDGSVVYACFPGPKLKAVYVKNGTLQYDNIDTGGAMRLVKLTCSRYGRSVNLTGDVDGQIVSRMCDVFDKTVTGCKVPVSQRFITDERTGEVRIME